MSYKELVEDVILQVECSDGKELFSGEPAKISACVDGKWTPIHDKCGEGESMFYRNSKTRIYLKPKSQSVTAETLLSIYCDYTLCKFATMDTETLWEVNHT